MQEGSSIFEISIRKAVENALKEESAETVNDYINIVPVFLICNSTFTSDLPPSSNEEVEGIGRLEGFLLRID